MCSKVSPFLKRGNIIAKKVFFEASKLAVSGLFLPLARPGFDL
jgi:hypothetical protein